MSLLSKNLKKFPYFLPDFKILTKIDEGGYSEVYLAESLSGKSEFIIKAPFKTRNSAKKLAAEALIMKELSGIVGVPQIIHSKIDQENEMLVTQKFDKSIESILTKKPNFNLAVTIQIGLQLLRILKAIHDKGIIHRDIKPGNLMISKKNPNQLFLIDYGLSKHYMKEGSQELFNLKKRNFKGTLMFASRNTHFGYSISRKDDLEAMGYTLVFLYKGDLPWSSLANSVKDIKFLGKIKSKFLDQGIYPDLPEEFKTFFDYIGNLKYQEIPDYKYMENLLIKMGEKNHVDLKDGFSELKNLVDLEYKYFSLNETNISNSSRNSNEDFRE